MNFRICIPRIFVFALVALGLELRAQTASDAAVPVRITAGGQAFANNGQWITASEGLTYYITYQGAFINSSAPGFSFVASYLGYTVEGGITKYWYQYIMTRLLTAQMSLAGDFIDGPTQASAASQSGGAQLSLSLGSSGVVRVEPGKAYPISLSRLDLATCFVDVSTPPQYRVILDGMVRNRTEGGNGNVMMMLVPRSDSTPPVAGFPSDLATDRIEWSVSLGSLKNGDSAGGLKLVDLGGSDVWSTIFTPAALQCEPTSDEIIVHREGGWVRQVSANQVTIDVVVPAGATDRFEVRCYNPEQMQGTSLPCTFIGDPFVTYTIRRSDDAGDPATALKIVREIRNVTAATGSFPVARTEKTKLIRTGTRPNYAWSKLDWHTGGSSSQEIATSVADSLGTSGELIGRVKQIEVRPPGNSAARVLVASRGYGFRRFGEAMISEVHGTTNATRADLTYYDDVATAATLGQVESVRLNSGRWEAYTYFTAESMGGALGTLHQRFRPFGAAATPEVTKDPAMGEVTTFQYTFDAFGRRSRPNLVETRINGVQVARTVTTYDDTSLEGKVIATRSEYSATSSALVSTTEYYSEGHENAFLRGKVTRQRNADGTTTRIDYEKGSWNGTVFVAEGEPKTASRIMVTTEDANGPVSGVSTRKTSIRDRRALVVREEEQVFQGGTWHLVGWTNFTYNFRGLLTQRESSNGAISTATWDGDRKVTEMDDTGRSKTFTYDSAGRVETVTEAGASIAGASAPATTTTYVYDALGRVREERLSGSGAEILVSTKNYDDAGRVINETPAGLGTTSFTYDPLWRRKTSTRPDGSTLIETTNLDGSPASATGTGSVHQYFSQGVETDGRRWERTDVGSVSSPRWVKTTKDWLGRKVLVQKPAFGGVGLHEETFLYHTGSPSPGKLAKTTVPGVAPTLYLYDTMGRLNRSGLDVDSAGTLVSASTDRIAEKNEYFEQIGADWWATSIDSDFPHGGANAGTLVQRAKSSRRLTGLGQTVSGGKLREEVRSWDYFGNETSRTVVVDAATKVVTTTTERVGTSLTQIETSLNGLPISVKSFEGLTHKTGYDYLGRAATSTDPRTGITTTTYHPNSRLVKEVKDPTQRRLQSTVYDLLGRPIFAQSSHPTSTNLNDPGYTTRTAYTLRGEVAQTWGSGTYPVSYEYNSFGERVKLRTYRDPSNAAVADSVSFPNLGSGDETTWEFDSATGLLRKKYDAKAKFVEYEYDTAGRMTRRYWARTLPSTSTRVMATYSYDPATGEQTGVAYNDGTPGVAYTYNRMGRTASVVQSYSGSSVQTLLDYCLCGKLTAEYFDATFFGGRNLSYALNPNADGFKGRTTGYALTVGSTTEQSVGYGYQSSTARIGSVSTQAVGSTAHTHTFTYAYRANSNLIESLAVDSGHPFTITRDFEASRDLLVSIETKWSTASRVKYAYTYDNLRQRSTVVQSGNVYADYGGTGADLGATHQLFNYNARGELTHAPTYLGSVSAGQTAANFMSARQHEYTYDGIGNRRTSNTSGVAGTKDNYVANELNQYVTRENNTLAVGGTVANDPAIKVAAGADALAPAGRHGRHWGDNILLNNLSGPYLGPIKLFAGKPGGGAGGADLLKVLDRTAFIPPAWQTFSYDADGNVLTDGVWKYTWDAENRLVALESMPEAVVAGAIAWADARRLEFRYDHQGRRVEKLVRGGWNGSTYATTPTLQRRFVYEGWNLIAEYSVTGSSLALVRSYTWGLDIVHDLTKSGGVAALLQISDHMAGKAYFPAYDGNGNVAALFDGAPGGGGTCVAAYEHSPYGEALRNEGTYAKENPFRFSTKFMDDETGLVYYGRRYFDPKSGRFLGRDPKGEAGGINLYGFTSNNPVNRWDVLGMTSPPATITTGVTTPSGQRTEQTMYWRDGEHGMGYYSTPSPNLGWMSGYSSGIEDGGEYYGDEYEEAAENSSPVDCEDLKSKINNNRQTLAGMTKKIEEGNLYDQVKGAIEQLGLYSNLGKDFAEGGYELGKIGLDMVELRRYRKQLTSLYKGGGATALNRLGFFNLGIDLWNLGEDIDDRDELAFASHLAGLSLNIVTKFPGTGIPTAVGKFIIEGQILSAEQANAQLDESSMAAYLAEQHRNAAKGKANIERWEQKRATAGCPD